MSKSATASASKIPPQLPTKSAWARGPPQNTATASSSRSQSPAPSPSSANPPANPHVSHSRRPSTLGQGVAIKDGVSVPRAVGAAKSGSSVTFGSIDDAQAPISSSPATAPAVKPVDGVKSFGSVAVQNGTSNKAAFTRPTSISQNAANASSVPSAPSPIPKIDKKDIAKLFQGPSVSSTPPSDTASPSTRPSSLPQPPHSASTQGSYGPTPFTPRGQGQNGSNGPPRSPSYPRAMANGTSGGVNVSGRPPAGPGGLNGAPMSAGMSSPRLAPHAHPNAAAGMPPPPTPQMWPGYYSYPYMTPGMAPEQYMAPSPYWVPQQLPPQHQHPHPPHPGPGGPPPPGGLPMSPRNPPPALPIQGGPGTPQPVHASLPPTAHTAGPHHVHAASLTSPPPTPSSAVGPGRLNQNANAFVPGKKISIKDSTGQELNIEALKRSGSGGNAAPGPTERVSPQPPASPALKRDPRRSSVRIESPEQKAKRIAEEQAKAQREKEKEDAAKKEKEDKERKEREKKEAEEKEKEEKKKREAEVKEAETRRKHEEEERVKKANEEKEAAEKRKREEEERSRREKEEAEKKKLEEERITKEAAETVKKEQEEKVRTEQAKEDEAKAKVLAASKEEGEIEEKKEVVKDASPADESKAKAPADKESLRIDTAVVAPEHPRRRPGPLNLSTAAPGSIPAPLPSALATARIIEDLGSVSYPEGIMSPKVELNVNAPAGKFKYDRDFLLQFMQICKEKPDNLPPLDAIGIEPSDQAPFAISRGGSGRKTNSGMSGGPGGVVGRQASIGLGFIPGSMSKSGSGGFAMGNFSTAAGVAKMSSEERFAMANGGSGRSTSVGGLGASQLGGGRPPPMVRTSSQGGPGSGKERDRTRSKRGEKRSDSNRVSVGHQQSMSNMGSMGPPLEPVAPLEQTANRWVPTSTKRVAPADQESPEIVDRKVKALLNKLTMERFDSISDQIVAWANKSEKEKDGRTLIQVIRLVFEKATDEATFSEMYARLCRKMMEMISSKVQDDGIKNSEGKPITGGLLFRKYLLNRCQEDFERGWVQKEATAAAAATKATEDQAAKEAAKGKDGKDGKEENELYSDEYYAAAKAKRRGLGLIRFIGELFKLQMLTERIMHECIKKLLGNVENPEEEEIESLCKLLTTVGQILDTQKAHAHMDVYFARMKELCRSGNVNSRMQFMLQDIIELRERKWIPRTQSAAPATIAQIHEAAAKEKAAQDKESYQRQMSMSRGGSRRGGDRGDGQHVGADGWAVAGNAPSRAPAKAGDLSHFGKINKAAPMTFGPSGIFAGKKDGGKAPGRGDTPISRTASTSNMFLALSGNPEIPAEVTKSSRPPSRKPSVDLGQAGVPEVAPQRRRLQLLPRSKPVEDKTGETPAGSEAGSEDEHAEDAAEATMSEADAKKKIDEDAKEFFSIRSIDEAENYFSTLPAAHRFRLVDKLAMQAVESKAADAELVAQLFKRAREKDLCSPAAFEDGFMPLAEIIDDVAIDAPKALELFAVMLKGAGLHEDEERRARIAEKSMDSEKLLGLLAS